jgi:hypothetical protein
MGDVRAFHDKTPIVIDTADISEDFGRNHFSGVGSGLRS